jgi:hypothetical protein
VRADLHHPALVQHDDRIGVADRRQPVRDDERRAVARQPLERLAHRRLAERVEVRGRLVEHQHRGILEERARDGHALALASRQPSPALTDHRVEAVGQSVDHLGERGRSSAARMAASSASGRARRMLARSVS